MAGHVFPETAEAAEALIVEIREKLALDVETVEVRTAALKPPKDSADCACSNSTSASQKCLSSSTQLPPAAKRS
jgi:hypothetical protein